MQTTSIRVYLAAHAPAEPQFWFVPKMDTDTPKEAGDRCEWMLERDKQRLLQWPLAWADEQIKLLGDQIDVVYFKKG
jgi:hypothetical protein